MRLRDIARGHHYTARTRSGQTVVRVDHISPHAIAATDLATGRILSLAPHQIIRPASEADLARARNTHAALAAASAVQSAISLAAGSWHRSPTWLRTGSRARTRIGDATVTVTAHPDPNSPAVTIDWGRGSVRLPAALGVETQALDILQAAGIL